MGGFVDRKKNLKVGSITHRRRTLSSWYYIAYLLTLFPNNSLSYAGQVDVRFSVQEILIEDSLKTSLPAQALWSFTAIDLSTDSQIIHAGNSRDSGLVPGSLVKLFVLSAVIDRDSREKLTLDTVIATDGNISGSELKGNLFLKGSGNAFLSAKDLERAVQDILSRGIRSVTGDIIADDSFFDARGWKSRWNGPAYTAPGALGLDLHTISITLSQNPSQVRVEPPNEAVKVSFNPGATESIRQIDDFTYEASGKVSGITKKRFPLQDPGLYTAWTFRTLLKEAAIAHKGSVKKGAAPSRATELSRLSSPSLSQVITDTNAHSLNIVAENLLLLLGAQRYGIPGTRQSGIQAVRDFLSHDLDMAIDDVTIADGSGLSSENKVTTEFLAAFLKAASARSWFGVFYDSLPKAGIDGSLRNFGYRNERVRAKAGRLDDAYCMAGYIEKNDGRLIAFSYMVNLPGVEVMGVVNTAAADVIRRLAED